MPKYIYQGVEFDESQLAEAAQASNMTIEEYIQEFNIEVANEDPGKEKGPAMEAAVAGPVTLDQAAQESLGITGLPSEELSSASPFPEPEVQGPDYGNAVWADPDSEKEIDYLARKIAEPSTEEFPLIDPEQAKKIQTSERALELQENRVETLTQQKVNQALQTKDTDMLGLNAFVGDYGQTLLVGETARPGANQLYDPQTGMLTSYESVSEAAITNEENAAEKAMITPLDVLKTSRTNNYYSIVALADEIQNYPFEVRNPTLAENIGDTLSALFGSEKDSLDDAQVIKSIVETGELPKNISHLVGSHPLAKRWNKAVDEFLITNRAIELNEDPTSLQSGFSDFAAGLEVSAKKFFGTSQGDQRDLTRSEAGKIFYDELKAAGLTVKEEFKEEVDNNISTLFAEKAGTTTFNLLELGAEIAAFTRTGQVTGVTGSLAKLGNRLVRATAANVKSPILRQAIVKSNSHIIGRAFKGGLQEGAMFVGAGQTYGQLLRDPKEIDPVHDFFFGFSMGAGNTIAHQVMKNFPISSILKGNTLEAYAKITKPKTIQGFQENLIGSASGATIMKMTELMMNNEEYIQRMSDLDGNFSIYKALNDFMGETAGLMAARGGKVLFTRGDKGFYHQLRNDWLATKDRSIESDRARKSLGINREDTGQELYDQLDRAYEVAQEEAAAGNTKKAAEIENNIEVIKFQETLVEMKEMLRAEKESGQEATDGEVLQLRDALRSLKPGEQLSEAMSQIFAKTHPARIAHALNVKLGSQAFESLNQNQLYHSAIQMVLNTNQRTEGAKVFAQMGLMGTTADYKLPKSAKLQRQQTFEYLSKAIEVSNKLSALRLKENKSESDNNRIKELEAELKEYQVGGERYNALQVVLKDVAREKISEDIQKQRDAGKTINVAKTPAEFQKQVDAWYEKNPKAQRTTQDVTGKDAVILPDGTKIINLERSVEVRQFSAATHEVIHDAGLLKGLRDENGNMTQEGIEAVDNIINSLTPKERFLLNQRMAGSGQATGRSKEEYYEEHLTHLGELINEGLIKYRDALGNKLLDLFPFIEKALPKLRRDDQTSRDIFKMIKDVVAGRMTAEDKNQINKLRESSSEIELKELGDQFSRGEISEQEYYERLDNILNFKEETKVKSDELASQGKEVDLAKLTTAQELVDFAKSVPKGSAEFAAAVEKLRPQFINIVLKAIKFSREQAKEEGYNISISDAKEWAGEFLYDAITKYDSSKGSFSNYVNNSYGRRGATLYKDIDKKAQTRSIDTPEGTREIAEMIDEGPVESVGLPEREIKKIQPKRFLNDKERIAEFEADVAKFIKENPDLDFATMPFRDTPNLAANAIAKILDIRPEQIKSVTKTATEKQGFLNTSTLFEVGGKLLKDKQYYKKRTEAEGKGKDFIATSIKEREDYRAARFLLRAYREGLLDVLPRYSVAPQLGKAAEEPGSPAFVEGYKENVRGTSLRLPNKFLKSFYTDAKSLEKLPEETDAMMRGWEENGRQIKNSYERWAEGMRSGGITSQAEILRLKDMSYEQVKEALKMPGRDEAATKDYMQFILGQIVLAGKLMTNSEIRRQAIENVEQANAFSAGKRREMFSENITNIKSKNKTGEEKLAEGLASDWINTTGYAQLRDALYTKKGEPRKQVKITDLEKLFKGNVRKFNQALKIFVNKGEKGLKEYTGKLDNPVTGKLIERYFEDRMWTQMVFANQTLKNRGLKYETFVNKYLKATGVETKRMGGFSNKGAGDLTIFFRDENGKIAQTYNIELKLNDSALLGSFTISEKSEMYSNPEFKAHPAVAEITDTIKKPEFQESKKQFEKLAIKIANDIGGKALVKNGVLYVSSNVREILVSEGYQSSQTIKVDTDGTIITAYQKGKKVNLLDFGNKGTFTVDVELAENHGIEHIETQLSEIGNVQLIGRYTASESVNGMSSLRYRIFLSLNKPLQTSSWSIMNPKQIKSFGAKEQYSATNIKTSKEIEQAANIFIEKGNAKYRAKDIVTRSEAVKIGAEVDKKNKISYTLGKISPENNDFSGLLYDTLLPGKEGVAQQQLYKELFTDPFNSAYNRLDNDKLKFASNFKHAKKQHKISDNKLQEKIEGTYFTTQDAIRVAIWEKQGHKIPDITDKQKSQLLSYIKENNLQGFVDALNSSNGSFGWIKPKENWIAGGIKSDIAQTLKGINRPIRLEKWQENVDAFFTENNLNKMQAAYGTRWRIAMENSLMRQQTGENRYYKMDSQVGKFADQLSGAILNTLNFNNKSAILQLTSATNFINWTDNNPLMAAAAFANQPQYWKDVHTLMMSDFLKERRSGLTMELNEADIAELAKGQGFTALTAKLLKLGMTPTVIADNIAIAGGGATFYRNRVKRYMREGGKVDELLVYNASPKAFAQLGERSGLIYLATNPREAKAYAEMNRGEVKNIYIDKNKIASEKDLIDTMNELGINTSEGSTYELIDPRFEDFYIGKETMQQVTDALAKKGFKAARYEDGAQVVSGKVESIVVFDKSVISDKKGGIKGGMSKEAAEKRALEDWRNAAETTQQSSRPDKVSMNQAGPLGRLVLAYTNTPQQYMREMQKAIRDAKNGRGDYKTNVSKVLYYGALQNFLFTGLQQGVNSVLFDDEEIEIPELISDEEFRNYINTLPAQDRIAEIQKRKEQLAEVKKLKKEASKKQNKELNTLNGMIDTNLKGLGLYGQILSTIKNAAYRTYLESQKDRPDYRNQIPKDLLAISPGLSVKYSQMASGISAFQYNMDEIKERGLGDFDNPAYMGAANILAGLTNAPLNRYLVNIRNIKNASDEELATSTRILSAAGWSEYALGIERPEWDPWPEETWVKFEEWKKERLEELPPWLRAEFFYQQKQYQKRQKEKNK